MTYQFLKKIFSFVLKILQGNIELKQRIILEVRN